MGKEKYFLLSTLYFLLKTVVFSRLSFYLLGFFCFVSLQVDSDIPGDRKTICRGEMYPTMYKISNSEMKILFQCAKCGKQHRNKRATDDEVENLDKLIKEYKKFFI